MNMLRSSRIHLLQDQKYEHQLKIDKITLEFISNKY